MSSDLNPAKKPRKVFGKKRGTPSTFEKEFVAQFVRDQPQEITPRQLTALANTIRRPKETVKRMIEDAKDTFVENVGRYVEIHKQATEKALENGDAKSLEVATRAAAWAIENTSAEGVRLVDKPEKGHEGTKIQIGVKIGGQNHPPVAVGVETT